MKTSLKKFKFILLFIFIISSRSAIAGQATIPNTFIPGTPALSSAVNENFVALKNAIDDNASRTMPLVKDGNNNTIGTLLSNGSWNAGMNFITTANYISEINMITGHIATSPVSFYFTSSDCSGSIYASVRSQSVYLANIGNGDALFYLPKASTPLTITANSNIDISNGQCNIVTPATYNAFQVFPNDPAVTGVHTVSYTLPIKIE